MPYRPRILVVDDNAASQEIISGFLTQHGFNVDLAGNGAGALVRMEGFRPHAMVVDLCMEGMTGQELIERVRADPRWHWLPILIASAASGAEVSAALEDARDLEGGRVSALRKPFEPDELLATLRRLLPERIPLPEKYPP